MSRIARRIVELAVGILLGATGVGCSPGAPRVLGQNPADAAATLASVRQHPGSGTVTVSGVMIEKCPQAGCWFVIRDATGTLRVDTKTAGFVVVDIPLNQQLTVAGQVITNGTEVLLAATGVRY